MKRIIIEADKCSGCKNCSIACMQAHTPGSTFYSLDLTDPWLESRNTIMLDSEKKCVPLFCRHCDDPECVKSCMSGAILKDPETGHIRYDAKKCEQCFMCVIDCPYGVLKPNSVSSSYVVRCDFCIDYDENPNCVKMCPKKAIYVAEV